MQLLVIWPELKDKDLELIAAETGADVLTGFTGEEALKHAPEADVILGGFMAPEVLAAASKCRWLQAPYAGVERILAAKWANPEMILTNGRGIFGPNISEHVIGLMLSFNRGFHLCRDNQNRKVWDPHLPIPFRELTGATVGILGYGDIGSHVAKRLAGFDCKVVGFRQHPGPGDEAQNVYGIDRLPEFMTCFDYLVCALPETEKTIGFLDKNLLHLLPSHAIIVNVGRGSLIPTEDLIQALEEGWIAGAGLDVTSPEPLPADNPLWAMPNVIITPHHSGFTAYYKQRALEIFLENWKHFTQTGKPAINVVDPSLGY